MPKKPRTPLPDRPRGGSGNTSHKGIQPPNNTQAEPSPQKRKKGRSKAITSCERCRQAHTKCVSQGPGAPCVNCAKRSARVCSFTQPLPNSDLNTSTDQKNHSTQLPQAHKLQVLATVALSYMENELLRSKVDATKMSSST
ncbi:hypothetical protein K445DRAFT_21177 [Daldinia sp. EC12]|nr:hypothetical protein K445DRAFT_21177 [Daldinia sp. EC12]